MVKINMMCGKRNFGDDWVHIDARKMGHIISCDIKLIDQFDNSIDLIYCSHGIAYFDKDEIAYIMKQWFKKLRPNGILRIATPNWDALKLFHEPVLGPLYGEMYIEDRRIYHKVVYSYNSLITLLEGTGFIKIRYYDHRTTDHPNTGNREDFYDDHSSAYINGTLISLNIECNKP